jgi:hypothetical protein
MPGYASEDGFVSAMHDCIGSLADKIIECCFTEFEKIKKVLEKEKKVAEVDLNPPAAKVAKEVSTLVPTDTPATAANEVDVHSKVEKAVSDEVVNMMDSSSVQLPTPFDLVPTTVTPATAVIEMDLSGKYQAAYFFLLWIEEKEKDVLLKLNALHKDFQSVETLFRTSSTTTQSMDEVTFPNWESNDKTSASFKFEFGMNWEDFSVQTTSFFWKVKKEQEKELIARQAALREDRNAGVEYLDSFATQCSAEDLSRWRTEVNSIQMPEWRYEEEWNWLQFKDKNCL